MTHPLFPRLPAPRSARLSVLSSWLAAIPTLLDIGITAGNAIARAVQQIRRRRKTGSRGSARKAPKTGTGKQEKVK